MATTGSQDREITHLIFDCFLDGDDCGDFISRLSGIISFEELMQATEYGTEELEEYMRIHSSPERIFDSTTLEDWAENHGFEKA